MRRWRIDGLVDAIVVKILEGKQNAEKYIKYDQKYAPLIKIQFFTLK